ncbi:STX7 protein, partial [Atractosteus spatula]|nr:STX7 protein [Atractosteus spatula]
MAQSQDGRAGRKSQTGASRPWGDHQPTLEGPCLGAHRFLPPLDSIEANVENADVHVQTATQQLARAAEYQVSSGRVSQTSILLNINFREWGASITLKLHSLWHE